MLSIQTEGISSGLSGWPYWSSDVAGFEGIPTPELASRWHQFGSVCSLYRSHGAREYNEPWSYGPEAEASIVKSIQLRNALKPYILQLAANATAYGTPLMRPIWFDFPVEMLKLPEVEDAFMLGSYQTISNIPHRHFRYLTSLSNSMDY